MPLSTRRAASHAALLTLRWRDGDLLGCAYAFEQATHLRKPPVLVDRDLIPVLPSAPKTP